MTITSFSESIIAGIVASVLTFLFVLLFNKYKYWQRFRRLSGTYRHYDVNGEPLLDGVTEVAYSGENILTTKGKSSEGEWVGRITMNKELPEYGSGIYQYLDRDDCGIHQIQVHPSGKSIYVLVVNTSHGKNFTFAYHWRREAGSS